MRITAILFDVDGVLYDSMPLHARSWVGSFKKFGFKVKSKSVYEAEGMRDTSAVKFIAKQAKLKLPESKIGKIVEKKQKLYDKYPKPKLIKGAKPLIKYLRENGYKICFVTGSSQPRTLARLKKDFEVSRRSVVMGKDVAKGKPHPEPFLTGLKKLKVSPGSALVVENAPLGIRSATRAKIRCIALSTGPLKNKELIREGAERVLKDCSSVLKFLIKTNSDKN